MDRLEAILRERALTSKLFRAPLRQRSMTDQSRAVYMLSQHNRLPTARVAILELPARRMSCGRCWRLLVLAASAALADDGVRTGPAAYGDWRSDAPGVRRLITPADLPPPYATPSAANPSSRVTRPPGALPKVPPGFSVDLVASGLSLPRVIRAAPNGDMFVAESGAGRVLVFRGDGQSAAPRFEPHVFAAGLPKVYGIAFYPPGPDPRWVYVATEGAVQRFAYRNGDLAASGPPEVIVRDLPAGGAHWTRDLAFSPDGKTMFVSVGSATNDADRPRSRRRRAARRAWTRSEIAPTCWRSIPTAARKRVLRDGPAQLLGPDGRAGERRPVVRRQRTGRTRRRPCRPTTRPGSRTAPSSAGPGSTSERIRTPATRANGPTSRPRAKLPDVLFQPHSAPLAIAFYQGGQFPSDYQGDAFVTFHGSWNRAKRTGYKVVRLLMKDGRPTGAYEDFLVGFVAGDANVWGRPVGVAVTKDGALLVTDDEGGAIWRVTYRGP